MFCGGGDLRRFVAEGKDAERYVLDTTRYLHAAISRFSTMNTPLIGAVNGTCGGGGFSLALCPDIVIAAASARFTMAYTRVGLTPDGSASYFLARMVGLRRAKEMALLNPVLDAEQALDWGLVNQVVADDRVFDTAMKIARDLAEGASGAIGETKRLILSGATACL